jgi:soluble lytic murein transglycosylase-like protein
LKAVAMQESGGNPNLKDGPAQGLMQITPQTQKKLGVEDPLDPVQSIFGAAKYLDEALRREKTPEDALRYYHGGPRWRTKYGEESRNYVPNVSKYYRQYQADQQAAQPPETPPAARDRE